MQTMTIALRSSKLGQKVTDYVKTMSTIISTACNVI